MKRFRVTIARDVTETQDLIVEAQSIHHAPAEALKRADLNAWQRGTLEFGPYVLYNTTISEVTSNEI